MKSLECYTIVIAFCALLTSSWAQYSRCGTCERSECERPVGCKDGFVFDACACCTVCAKVNGIYEKCGGLRDELGTCKFGLSCDNSYDIKRGIPFIYATGICVSPEMKKFREELLARGKIKFYGPAPKSS